jgi:23S rRNA-/tRNA-specific pseudouridylate synthase
MNNAPFFIYILKVVIKQPIGVVRYPGVAQGLYVASPEGKPAFSKVFVLERDREKNCSLVKVEIQSGRPHQIRIHLAYMGHPLVGDPLYVAGGQPKCFDPDLVDDAAAFAEDGYKIRSSFFILIVSVYLEMNSPWKLNNI